MNDTDIKTECYQSVFIENVDGGDVLMDILNENNYFSTDAEIINPQQIAFCNKLLVNIGVLKPDNIRKAIDTMLQSIK